MKVYSIVSENLNKAIMDAKKIHGENIQILYEKTLKKQFPFPNRVEIGYCVLKRKNTISSSDLEEKILEDKQKLDFFSSSKEYIRKTLFGLCFSYEYIEDAIECFTNRIASDKSIKDVDDVEKFLKDHISSSIKINSENYYNIPKILVLAFPYPLKRVSIISSILSYYSNLNGISDKKKISLINIGDEVEVKDAYYTYNCDNPNGFISVLQLLNECDNIIVNLSEKYCGDQNFYRYLSEAETLYHLNSISFLVIPSFLSYREINDLSTISNFTSSVVVAYAEENVIYGNIVSICSKIKKDIAFFIGTQGVSSLKSNFI